MTEKIPTGMVALGDWLGCCRWVVVVFICSVVSDCLQPHGLQHARLLCPSPSPRVCTNSCLLSRWWPPNHLILCHPLLLPSIFPSIRVFSSESSVYIKWPKYWSFSFSINPSNDYQDWFPLGLNGFISLQESSWTPQFKSIHSSVLSLLYGPTLTFIYDYWKNHSFDYLDHCQQSDVSAF